MLLLTMVLHLVSLERSLNIVLVITDRSGSYLLFAMVSLKQKYVLLKNDHDFLLTHILN